MKRIWIISLCFLLFGCGVVKESEKYKDLTKMTIVVIFQNLLINQFKVQQKTHLC